METDWDAGVLVTLSSQLYASGMITQIKEGEWMVEPTDPDCREYARLHIKVVKSGLNIDGQAIIPWEDLLAKKIRLLSKPNGR